jgi:hypothetical protein
VNKDDFVDAAGHIDIRSEMPAERGQRPVEYTRLAFAIGRRPTRL